jgi:hypothetical protein
LVRSSRSLKIFALLFSVVISVLVALQMRPIQDDYLSFGSIESVGILGYLKTIWAFHGGNMVQFTIHSIMSIPSTTEPFFLNLAAYFLLTQLMVAAASRLLFAWVFEDRHLKSNVAFWLPFLVVFGFEGFFVPGFVGAYGFTLASLAHLWPILCLIFALRLLMSESAFRFLVIPLGLVAGNSNLVESAFSCLVITFVILGIIKYPSKAKSLGFRKSVWLYVFCLVTYISSLTIAIAPGFKNRSSGAIGLPENLHDFILRFGKSFAIFSADVLTHPFVYLSIFCGFWIARTCSLICDGLLLTKLKILSFFSICFWLLLILGSSMAYPAWHQSMGLYVFVIPTALTFGIFLSLKFPSVSISYSFKFVMVLNLVIAIALFARVVDTSITRKSYWDRAFAINVCLLHQDPAAKLEGAEIIYPPFNLGVEDVNTWEWIRNDYSKWVLNPRFDSKVACKN